MSSLPVLRSPKDILVLRKIFRRASGAASPGELRCERLSPAQRHQHDLRGNSKPGRHDAELSPLYKAQYDLGVLLGAAKTLVH
jgi:hypothetical protein